MSDAVLRSEIRATLMSIDRQIDSLTREARKIIEASPYPECRSIYDVRDTSGKLLFSDLLLAKSNCLLALTNARGGK